MTKIEKENLLSATLCLSNDAHKCTFMNDSNCKKYGKCRICEKTEEQLDYILSQINTCTYLEACAGSGKTEVLGMKTAFEICRWERKSSGIAVLTFTNEAANTITERVRLFCPHNISSMHYIGTFASFVHGYIAQKFGYAFFQKGNNKLDKSFSIIDENAKIYNKAWLKNYKLDFPIAPKIGDIYANQLSFNSSNRKWHIRLGENNIPEALEFYNKPEMQENIRKIRNIKKQDFLYKFKFLNKKIIECKGKFWKDGFATFEDMNLIARYCLENDNIAKRLAKKFPLIMVDECQDLSFIELKILDLLRNAGSVIHFIGDLNQAIYSFKNAKPEYLKKQIEENNFKIMRLTDNFRSCQRIVDVASALQSINQDIKGHEQDLCSENAAVYYEYGKEAESVDFFIALLNRYNFKLQDATVLVRNSSLKDKLNAGIKLNDAKHAIINAVQLWKNDTQQFKKQALLLLGLQIQKWLESKGRKDNYFCPDTFDNVFHWRLMLRDILNDLVANKKVNTFNERTYAEWYHSAKKDVISIVDSHIQKVLGVDKSIAANATLRVPANTGPNPIQIITSRECLKIRIDTIHSVKGCSFNAVLLVSSANKQGKTGYWENWIDDKDETTRFAYVASTRPKYLLVWAVPKLTNEQRIKIESIGLRKLMFNLQ